MSIQCVACHICTIVWCMYHKAIICDLPFTGSLTKQIRLVMFVGVFFSSFLGCISMKIHHTAFCPNSMSSWWYKKNLNDSVWNL